MVCCVPVHGPENRWNAAEQIKMRVEDKIVAKGKGMVSDQIYYVMPKEWAVVSHLFWRYLALQEIARSEDRSIFIMSLSVLENLMTDSVVIMTSYQMQFKSSSH